MRRIPQADERSCPADAHVDLEHDKAKFYLREPQFSTPKDSLRDPAFAYRGDIIVGDQGIKFSILKRLQSSLYTVRWFGHSELEDLLRTQKGTTERDCPHTRGFIVVEGFLRRTAQSLFCQNP